MAVPFNIPPSHVSHHLRHLILPDGMSVTEIARRLGVSRQSVDALLNERRGLSAEMAKRIEMTFGGSAKLMMALQQRWDLAQLESRTGELAEQVTPFEWPDRKTTAE